MQDIRQADCAVLLLEGFDAVPGQAQWLEQALSAAGYTVVPLPVCKAADSWTRQARQLYTSLASRYARVYAVGLALGGTLALVLAEEYPLEGVVAFCAPARNRWDRGVRRTMARCKSNLFAVTARTLLLQTALDERAQLASAQAVYRGISAEEKHLVWLRHSANSALAEADKPIVLHKILNFLRI